MKFKVECVPYQGDVVYKAFYKKWWWINWKDTGMMGTDEDRLLELVKERMKTR